MKSHVLARWLILPAFFLLFWAVASAVDSVEAQSPTPPYDEAEAQAIDRMLMCPVCPAENIDQAQVELARQMRQKVREMLAAGASRDEILRFFVDRYGPDVLATPPKSGFNLLAWVLPPVALAAALVSAWLVLRSMVARRRGALAGTEAVPEPPFLEADLEPYLDVVEQELAQYERPDVRLSNRSVRQDREASIRQAHDEANMDLNKIIFLG